MGVITILWPILNSGGSSHINGRLKLESSILYTVWLHQMLDLSIMGVVSFMWHILNFWAPIIFWMGEARHFKRGVLNGLILSTSTARLLWEETLLFIPALRHHYHGNRNIARLLAFMQMWQICRVTVATTCQICVHYSKKTLVAWTSATNRNKSLIKRLGRHENPKCLVQSAFYDLGRIAPTPFKLSTV